MKRKVVFICGALRSGSSLTHLMLDHHPEIKNPGEFDFLFDQVADNGELPRIDSYHQWLALHRIFQSKQLSVDPLLSYADLTQSFIEQLSQPNSVLALNIHRGFDRIPFLCPDAKFIHLIRDPRDVAKSSIGMGWAGNVYYGIDHWLDTELAWKRLQAKILPEQYFELKFEDLILSPETVLKELCLFIAVPYSEKMFNYVDESTYSQPDPSLVRQWKTKLTIREVQYVESKAQKLMSELGYDASGYPLIFIGPIERFWLKVSNKLFKMKFAIKRYGFSLYCKERISRFLKLESLNNQARLMINKVDQQYLK